MLLARPVESSGNAKVADSTTSGARIGHHKVAEVYGATVVEEVLVRFLPDLLRGAVHSVGGSDEDHSVASV